MSSRLERVSRVAATMRNDDNSRLGRLRRLNGEPTLDTVRARHEAAQRKANEEEAARRMRYASQRATQAPVSPAQQYAQERGVYTSPNRRRLEQRTELDNAINNKSAAEEYKKKYNLSNEGANRDAEYRKNEIKTKSSTKNPAKMTQSEFARHMDKNGYVEYNGKKYTDYGRYSFDSESNKDEYVAKYIDDTFKKNKADENALSAEIKSLDDELREMNRYSKDLDRDKQKALLQKRAEKNDELKYLRERNKKLEDQHAELENKRAEEKTRQYLSDYEKLTDEDKQVLDSYNAFTGEGKSVSDFLTYFATHGDTNVNAQKQATDAKNVQRTIDYFKEKGYTNDAVINFADYRRREVNEIEAAERKATAQGAVDWAIENDHPGLATVLTSPVVAAGADFMSGATVVPGLVENYKHKKQVEATGAKYLGTDMNSAYKSYSDIRDIYRNNALEDANGIERAMYGLAESSLTSLYGAYLGRAVTSGLSSATGIATGAGTLGNKAIRKIGDVAGGSAIAVQAYEDTFNDLMGQGIDEKKARTVAGLAAAAEVIGETISIGKFNALKELPVDELLRSGSFKELVNVVARNLGISSVVNASEETFTELMNIASEIAVLGSDSEFEKRRDYYKANGDTSPTFKAVMDMGKRVGEAGLSGLAQGLLMGGVGSSEMLMSRGMSDSRLASFRGNDIMSQGREQETIDTAKAAGGAAEKYAQKIVDKRGGLDSLKAKDLGKIAESTATELKNASEETKEKVKSVADTYRTEREKALDEALERASKVGIKDETVKRAFYDNYSGGDMDAYARSFANAAQLASTGIEYTLNEDENDEVAAYQKFNEMLVESGDADALSPQAIYAAYATGTNSSVSKKGAHLLASMQGYSKTKQKILKNQIAIADEIGKQYGGEEGLSITFVRGMKNKNGFYRNRTNSNQIVIDLDASGGLILRTVAHEVYHWLNQYDRTNNTAFAQPLKDKIIEYYKENKGEKWLNDRLDEYYKGYSDEQKTEEFVADHMYDVMYSDRMAQELAESNPEFATKLQQHIQEISDFVRQSIERLKRSVMESGSLAHEEIIAMEDDLNALDRINEMYINALKGVNEREKRKAEYNELFGGEKENVALKATNEAGDTYSIKRDSKGKEYWNIETQTNIFKGLKTKGEIRQAAYDFLIGNRDAQVVYKDKENREIGFIRLSAEEFASGDNSQSISDDEFKTKMKTVTSLQDLLLNYSVEWNSPDHKNHKLFKEKGFRNYRGRLGIDGAIFNYVVRVGKAKFGDVFYDIELEVDQYLPRAKSVSGINKPTSVNQNTTHSTKSQGDNTNSTKRDYKYLSGFSASTLVNKPGPAPQRVFSLKRNTELTDNAIKYNNEHGGKVNPLTLYQTKGVMNVLANFLRENFDRLGLPADIEGNTAIGNASYGGVSEESTTLCPRSLALTEFADAVSDIVGRPLTVKESLVMAEEAAAWYNKNECIYCYVAMDRKAKEEFVGKYIKERNAIIKDVKNGMDRKEAYKKYLNGRKDTKPMQARWALWMDILDNGGEFITAKQLASHGAQSQSMNSDNKSVSDQAKDAMKYAQSASWAKKVINYLAYNGHILKWSEDKIRKLNAQYGLRMYSFSDYSPAYILENMQMVMDASVRGLKMLAYTKEADFVKIFAGTGMNINVSTFAHYDAKTDTVIEDNMYGVKWSEAQQLRKEYGNVGVVFVATNDKLVEWGLAQDWIDVVIPFHLVRTGQTVAQHFNFKDFTSESADVKTKEWKKGDKKTIYPPQHNNDKETFLRLCAENHLTPRFERWVDNPNYMKLVNETRKSAKDTPAVQPTFDQDAIDAAYASLNQMIREGGYMQHVGVTIDNMHELAHKVAETVKSKSTEKESEYTLSTKRDREYFDAIEKHGGDSNQVKNMVRKTAEQTLPNSKARDDKGKLLELYHGTGDARFSVFRNKLLFFTKDFVVANEYASGTKKNARIVSPNRSIDTNILRKPLADIIKFVEKHNGVSIKKATFDDVAEEINNTDDFYKEMYLDFVEQAEQKLKDIDRDSLSETKKKIYDIQSEMINIAKEIWSGNKEVTEDRLRALDDGRKATTQLFNEALDRSVKNTAETGERYTDIVKFARQFQSATSELVGKAEHYFEDDYFKVSGNKFLRSKQNIEDMARSIINQTSQEGIYRVFLNMENPLVLDAHHEGYRGFSTPYGTFSTDSAAEYALKNGYDGVIIKNVMDSATTTDYDITDDYIVFDSSQVKSADPVTYDDKGNIIPLSERFNSKNEDIRYSKKRDVDNRSEMSNNNAIYDLEGNKYDSEAELLDRFPTLSTIQRTSNRENILRQSRENTKSYGRWLENNRFVKEHDRIPKAGGSGYLEKLEESRLQAGAEVSVLGALSRIKLQKTDTAGRVVPDEVISKFGNTLFKSIDGRLLSAFHWTETIFIKFGEGDIGFHLGTLRAAMNHQADVEFQKALNNNRIENSIIKECYLNIINPCILSMDPMGWNVFSTSNLLFEAGYFTKEDMELIGADIQDIYWGKKYGSKEVKNFIRYLEQKGYDSIIYKNRFEGDYSVIVFNPDQIYTVAENGIDIERSTGNGGALSNAQDDFSTPRGEDVEGYLDEATDDEIKAVVDAVDKELLGDAMYYGRKLGEQKQKTEQKVKEQRRKDVAYYQQRMKEIREDRDQKLIAQKVAYKAAQAKRKENSLRIDYRAKIIRKYDRLQKMTTNPTEKQHVPAELMHAIAGFLGDITPNMLQDETRKDGTVIKKRAKNNNRLIDLVAAYKAIQNDYEDVYDPEVANLLDEASTAFGSKYLDEMDSEELADVNRLMSAIEHTVRYANKALVEGKERNAFSLAKTLIRQSDEGKKSSSNFFKRILWSQLNPYSFFHAMSNYEDGGWMDMYKILNEGQLRKTRIQTDVVDAFKELMINEELDKLSDYKDGLVDVGLVGADNQPIKITRGLMLSLYLHLQNEQNRKHIAEGGLTLPNLARYYKGDEEAWGNETVRTLAINGDLFRLHMEQNRLRELKRNSNSDDIRARYDDDIAELEEQIEELRGDADRLMDDISLRIESELTDYERNFLDKAKWFFNEYSKEKLNEATMQMYGFKKAREENYMPIISDPDFLNAQFDAVARDASLESLGFMKDRQKGANNAIKLFDLTDVINAQLNKVSKFAGLAPSIKEFQRVYNKAFFNDNGVKSSVQEAAKQRFGVYGGKYVGNLLADLQGGRKAKGSTDVFAKLRGASYQAALMLNLRVAMAQAGSYPTAAAEVGWRPLMRALAKGGKDGKVISRADRELIDIYTPLLANRFVGGASTDITNVSRNNKHTIRGLENRALQHTRALTDWISMMDTATVGRLWSAAEYYVDEHYNLDKGSEGEIKSGESEYYKKVAEVFNRIVERTQPSYTTMQRPELLRNPNEMLKMFTMFMTQRAQNFNLVYDAAATFAKEAEKRKSGVYDAATYDEARRTLARTALSQAVAGVTLATFKAIADAIQHNMKGYKDDDDEITILSVLERLLKTFAESEVSNMLGGSELFSFVESAVTGSPYYGITANVAGTIEDMSTAISGLIKNGVNEKTLTKVATSTGMIIGIPAAQMKKWVDMFKGWAEDIMDGGEIYSNVTGSSSVKSTTEKMVKKYLDGDMDDYRKIRESLKGENASTVKTNITSYLREQYVDGKLDDAEVRRVLSHVYGMSDSNINKKLEEFRRRKNGTYQTKESKKWGEE